MEATKKIRLMQMFLIMLLSIIPVDMMAYYSYGARSAGMGGAFVALADDASAIYWNPANIALIKDWNIGIDYGQEANVAKDAQELLSRIYAQKPESELGRDTWMTDLTTLGQMKWVVRGGDHISLAVAHQGMAFSIQGYQLFYAQPDIGISDPSDGIHDPLSDQALIHFSGFDIQEYGISYAWVSKSREFCMGFTGKYIDINALNHVSGLWDLESIEPVDLLLLDEKAVSYPDSQWGIDAGLVFLGQFNRVGISARNLRGYSIEPDDGPTFEVKPEYRIGYAFLPNDRFAYTIDYAINENRDPFGESIDGKDLAMGFESKLGDKKSFILRGGASMEMDGDSPLMFSGGASLVFSRVILDGAYSTDMDQESKRLWGGIRIFL